MSISSNINGDSSSPLLLHNVSGNNVRDGDIPVSTAARLFNTATLEFASTILLGFEVSEVGEMEDVNEDDDDEDEEEAYHRTYMNWMTIAVTRAARWFQEQNSEGTGSTQLIRETMDAIVSYYTYILERTYSSEMRSNSPLTPSSAIRVLEEVFTQFNVNLLHLQDVVLDSSEVEEEFDSFIEQCAYHFVMMRTAVCLLAEKLNDDANNHHHHHHRGQTELLHCLRLTWCNCQMYFSILDEYLTMHMLNDDTVSAVALAQLEALAAAVGDESDENSEDDSSVVDVDSDASVEVEQ